MHFFSTYAEKVNMIQLKNTPMQTFQGIWFEKWNIKLDESKNMTRKRPDPQIIDAEPMVKDFSADAYNIMTMCFVVRKGKERPKWEALAWCFHWKVWLWLTAAWLASGLAWFYINKQSSLVESLFEIYCLIITSPFSSLPKLTSNLQRFLSGLLMLMSIVIITGFQSNLYKNIQIPMFYPSINQIKQIKQLNLPIVCAHYHTCLMLFGKIVLTKKGHQQGNYTNQLFLDMTRQLFRPNLHMNLNRILQVKQECALITPCEPAYALINKIPSYSKKLHVVKETITTFPLYLGKFPFLPQLQKLLMLYLESGIGQRAEHMAEWKKFIRMMLKEKPEPLIRVFTMDDVQVAFIILFIGLFFGTLVFLMEWFSHYCHSQNN